MLLLFLCISVAVVTSCIDDTLMGKDGKEKIAPVADAGMDRIARPGAVVYLDGSFSRDVDGRVVLYKWQVTGCSWAKPPVISNVDTVTPVFRVPTDAREGQTVTMQLTVTDDDGLTATDDITITVKENLDRVETIEEYGAILHAAYAGIGYGDTDDQEDDAFLYDAVMEDINTVSVDFALNLMEELIGNETKLYNLSIENPVTVTLAETGSYSATLSIQAEQQGLFSDKYTFSGSIQVDFNEYAFNNGRVTYSGTGTCDLKIDFTGACTVSYTYGLSRFIVDTVSIMAYDTLRAQYADHAVSYGGWRISYSVNDTMNRMLMANSLYFDIANPLVDNPPDNRDYLVGGTFSVDGTAYDYTAGFRYRQSASATYEGLTGERNVLSVQGTMTIPGTDRIVAVDSLYDPVSPLGSGSITRGVADGLWKSGELTINGMDMTVGFFISADDEIADFSGSGLSETARNWQSGLDPYQ